MNCQLKTSKTKYISFYKKRVNPKKVTELKFLGVMIEESLNRKTHVKLAERKISKNYCSLF